MSRYLHLFCMYCAHVPRILLFRLIINNNDNTVTPAVINPRRENFSLEQNLYRWYRVSVLLLDTEPISSSWRTYDPIFCNLLYFFMFLKCQCKSPLSCKMPRDVAEMFLWFHHTEPQWNGTTVIASVSLMACQASCQSSVFTALVCFTEFTVDSN